MQIFTNVNANANANANAKKNANATQTEATFPSRTFLCICLCLVVVVFIALYLHQVCYVTNRLVGNDLWQLPPPGSGPTQHRTRPINPSSWSE